MRSGQYLQNFKTFAAAIVFTLAAVVVFDGSAYAQRGKGDGKHRGGPPGHQKQVTRQQWGGGNIQKQRGGKAEHRQRQRDGNNARAQQQMRVRNAQGQQNRAVQRAARQQQSWKVQRQQVQQRQPQYRQQQQQYRQAQRKQQMNVWNARRQVRQRQNIQQQAVRQRQFKQRGAVRQQKSNNRKAHRQQQQQWANWNQARQRQVQWNSRQADKVRARRKQVHVSPVQIVPGYAWTGRQWGQSNAAANRHRRDLNNVWKAERKAQRRFEKDQRRYDRKRNSGYSFNYYGSYANTYYVDDYDYGYDRPSWKDQLLRTVIGGFLGRGRSEGSYRTYDRYDDRRYERPVYYSEDVPRYYRSPIFVGYSPDYVDEPEYYYNDYDDGGGFDLGGIFGQLPIQELLTGFAGDGFVSELLGNLVVQGYDEGFLAGQAAREYGYDDGSYNNPYVFEGGFCDPYSVSIGDNREMLGEGYALGYQDALSGRDDYDPYSDGNADLVSTLLSGVLGRV